MLEARLIDEDEELPESNPPFFEIEVCDYSTMSEVIQKAVQDVNAFF